MKFNRELEDSNPEFKLYVKNRVRSMVKDILNQMSDMTKDYYTMREVLANNLEHHFDINMLEPSDIEQDNYLSDDNITENILTFDKFRKKSN